MSEQHVKQHLVNKLSTRTLKELEGIGLKKIRVKNPVVIEGGRMNGHYTDATIQAYCKEIGSLLEHAYANTGT